jgi:hypothetical protein
VSSLRTPPILDVSAGVRADRITAAGASEVLDRLGNPALLDAGLVSVIGLDAIRRKLGDRWPIKRAQIWDHVERELERTLSPADIFLRTDDVSYTIAQPGSDRYAAQAVCFSILQEVLKFFLGESRTADIDVRTVSSIASGQMTSQPVDLTKLRRGAAPQAPVETPAEQLAAAATGPLADHAPAAAHWKPPLAGRSSTIELSPPMRGGFDLKLTVDGVWNLKRGLITSFLIERGGVRGKHDMADLEEIDVATLVYASTLLDEQVEQGGSLTLHLPLSFASLATQRTRQRLWNLTHAVRESMRRMVLLEIADLDPGVPPSRLIEVVGLMRSLCVGIVGRVRPTKAALAAVRGCGLRGVAVSAEHLAPHQPDFDARLKAFVALARDISPNLLIHGLPDPKLIDVAAAAGFTHASTSEA